MIKNWIRNYLGISDLKTRLFNMDNDIIALMDKQLNPLMTLPVDPPECNPNSPYEYLDAIDSSEEYGWYAIWHVGFAGPFYKEEEAMEYIEYNELLNRRWWSVEKLYRYPFTKKCEKKTS